MMERGGGVGESAWKGSSKLTQHLIPGAFDISTITKKTNTLIYSNL